MSEKAKSKALVEHNARSLVASLPPAVIKIAAVIGSLVTDAQVHTAIMFVRQFATRQLDDVQKREQAVARVQSALKIPDSLARFLVEMAVQIIKTQGSALLDDIEALLSEDHPDPGPGPVTNDVVPAKASPAGMKKTAVRKKAGKKR